MKKVLIFTLCLFVLAACGGGGGTSQTTGNPTTGAAPVTKITYIESGTPATGGKPATVRFFLTDAPNPQIDSAVVTISDMTVHKTGGPFFSVLSGNRTLDLMDLQNGITSLLGEAALEPGKYTQIRFAVVSGSVESGGKVYDVVVPSDKIRLNRNIDICSGGTVDIVLDFDAQQSLRYNKGQNVYKMSPVVKIASVTSNCPAGTGGEDAEKTYTGPTGWLSVVIPALPVSDITYSLKTTMDDIWVHDQGIGMVSIFKEAYAIDLLEPSRQVSDPAIGGPYTVVVPPVKVPVGTLDQVRLLFQPIVATDSEGRTITIKLPPDQLAEASGLKFFGSVKVCENALTVLQWDLDLSPAKMNFGSTDLVFKLHPEIHGVNLRVVCAPYTP